MQKVLVIAIGVYIFLFSLDGVSQEKSVKTQGLTIDSKYSHWIFTGKVHTDTGENFGYVFQMRREGQQFFSMAAIVDSEKQQLLLFDEGKAVLDNPKMLQWQVGNAFLSFNAINESWIFGFHSKEKDGFNFKVDMLGPSLQSKQKIEISKGVHLVVNQTGRLNGHIQIAKEKKEYFVTAHNTWYRQVWLNSPDTPHHIFSSLFCRFIDGSGLYSVNLKEQDAEQGAMAGICDARGNASKVSQFIETRIGEQGEWHIDISSPQNHFQISNLIIHPNVHAGFITQGNKHGFCMASQDTLPTF